MFSCCRRHGGDFSCELGTTAGRRILLSQSIKNTLISQLAPAAATSGLGLLYLEADLWAPLLCSTGSGGWPPWCKPPCPGIGKPPPPTDRAWEHRNLLHALPLRRPISTIRLFQGPWVFLSCPELGRVFRFNPPPPALPISPRHQSLFRSYARSLLPRCGSGSASLQSSGLPRPRILSLYATSLFSLHSLHASSLFGLIEALPAGTMPMLLTLVCS